MIKEFNDLWYKNHKKLQRYFESTIQYAYCESYKSLLVKIFEYVINDSDSTIYSPTYDFEKITEINNGFYSGTIIFIIPEQTFQPYIDEYIYTYVEYGSYSACDTLSSILNLGSKEFLPIKEQVDQYMSLCLHLIQRMEKFKEIN